MTYDLEIDYAEEFNDILDTIRRDQRKIELLGPSPTNIIHRRMPKLTAHVLPLVEGQPVIMEGTQYLPYQLNTESHLTQTSAGQFLINNFGRYSPEVSGPVNLQPVTNTIKDTITLQDLRDTLGKFKNYFSSIEHVDSLIKDYYDRFILGKFDSDKMTSEEILEDILKET